MSEKSKSAGGSTKWIVIGVLALIATAFVIAVIAGNGSDDANGESTPDSTTEVSNPGGGSVPSAGTAAENQPVRVNGQALDPLGSTGADLSVGANAPEVTGSGFDGTPISVTPGDGTPYMLVFLAHWCPHCNAEVPRLVEWNASGMVPDGLRVIGISTAVAADRPNYPPSKWIVEKEWPFEVMADSTEMDAAGAYGVDGFPFFVVVGADGQVKVRASGEQGIEVIDRLVRDALAS
jgi:cytochrome c biogenesis protein CcmG/thiol:disulfide interchange protein DsbE